MVEYVNRVQKNIGSLDLGNPVYLLICALNDDWNPDDYQFRAGCRRRTALVLIGRIQQIEKLAKSIGADLVRSGGVKPIPLPGGGRAPRHINSTNLQKLQDKLSRFCSRFQAHPGLRFRAWVHSGQEVTIQWQQFWTTPTRERYWYDISLFSAVLDLTDLGLVKSFRRCDYCKRWFFARRTVIDRFCNSECRELFHRTNEGDKERRRKWAKENYQSRKELELGARKAARRRRKK